MGLGKNRRGMSGEVMKIGAALLLALLVFTLLLNFSISAQKADSDVKDIGEDILNFSQKTSFQVRDYPNDTK